MASTVQEGPRAPVVESMRVDKVSSRARLIHNIRATLAVVIALIGLIPIFWMGMTAFKSRPDAVSVPPKVFFSPSLEGFVNLLTDRVQLSQDEVETRRQDTEGMGLFDRVALERGRRSPGRASTWAACATR